ncbi:dynein regulatory complex protein 8 isoform X2 [Bos javanicus]|uniref:dynein regulatory complex protein 8 isoform X2 n=1 Tax=Bos javanicus TaxID=9906 RepID=UPI002AA8BB8F|nr:dynein regulatory complex protein 8 isoform X2 [Bos javanicus]
MLELREERKAFQKKETVSSTGKAHQVPLSKGFSRQEYWSGLPFPSPGDLPSPGTESTSPALAGGFFTTEPPEVAVAEFHKKIKEAFEVFDHESNNTVDVREVGTIIRSLGCCPSEGELHDLIAEVEEEEPTGYIRFEKFLPVMTEVLLERRYRPIPEDILLRAFEVLDPAKRGFLSKDELIKYMTEEGEPFSQEEMEEMLSAAIDPESNSIHYKDYITMMVIDEN